MHDLSRIGRGKFGIFSALPLQAGIATLCHLAVETSALTPPWICNDHFAMRSGVVVNEAGQLNRMLGFVKHIATDD